MKTSSDIARQFQYIILVVLSLFAIVLWKHSSNEAAKIAVAAQKSKSRKAKQPQLPVVETLNDEQRKIFEEKFCPLMKPEEKIVKEFKEQTCNCHYHNVGKLSEARGQFLRKRLKETMLVEVEDITHTTKEGCLLLPDIKDELQGYEDAVHEERLNEMRYKDKSKKLDHEKDEILYDTLDMRESLKILEQQYKDMCGGQKFVMPETPAASPTTTTTTTTTTSTTTKAPKTPAPTTTAAPTTEPKTEAPAEAAKTAAESKEPLLLPDETPETKEDVTAEPAAVEADETKA